MGDSARRGEGAGVFPKALGITGGREGAHGQISDLERWMGSSGVESRLQGAKTQTRRRSLD